MTTAGVIYGVHIERAKTDGPMRAGPVVTLCVRLPEWVILDSQTEYSFKTKLSDGVKAAVEIVTGSEQSQANRQLQNK